MWSINLRQPDKTVSVFGASNNTDLASEDEKKIVASRHAVRRVCDTGHVYCIAETQNSNSEVFRVGLSADPSDSQDK